MTTEIVDLSKKDGEFPRLRYVSLPEGKYGNGWHQNGLGDPGRIEIMLGGPSQNELIHALDMTILCNGLIEHLQLKRFLYSHFVQASADSF